MNSMNNSNDLNDNIKARKVLNSISSKYINTIIEEDVDTEIIQHCNNDNTNDTNHTNDTNNNDTNDTNDNIKVKKTRTQTKQGPLQKYYAMDMNVEIGVDEAGRGPLFGRVYSGAVILPKDDSFDHSKMKDSKKFHSKNKINEAAEYIKEHALAWSVGYECEVVIDNINILQATQ